MVRPRFLAVVITIAIATLSSIPFPVHAAGTVYVNPPTTMVGILGDSFTVQVQAANLDPFNGWDIQIVTDPTVINATGLSTVGNIFEANYSAQPFPLASCVNGAGSGCNRDTDGPGVVHSAMVFSGTQLPPQGSSNGLLFSITYKIVGSNQYSPIVFQKSDITNGATLGTVAVSPQGGVYGTSPAKDFTFTLPFSNARLAKGTNSNLTLTLSSLGGFSGIVSITNKTTVPGLSINLNATGFALGAQQQAHVILRVAASNSTSAIQYSIILRATSGSLFHILIVKVTVAPNADFILVATPSLLKIHAGNAGSSTVSLSTQSGFSGTISLTMNVPPVPGLIALLANKTVTITPDDPASTVFAIQTPDSALPFQYLVNITATSQSLTHSFTIVIRSPLSDFGFVIGGTGYVVQAGQSRTFTLTISSVDYFKGQIFLLATSLSGAKQEFSKPVVFLEYGNYSTSTLTISTDLGSAPGNHVITLTALGTTFLGATVNHSINMTLTVTSPLAQAAILGLHPVAYFGVMGVLWVALIGVAIREIKKPKPKRFLT